MIPPLIVCPEHSRTVAIGVPWMSIDLADRDLGLVY
jgi:hypothetical protein